MPATLTARGFGTLPASSLWSTGSLSDPTMSQAPSSVPPYLGSYLQQNAGTLWGINTLSDPTSGLTTDQAPPVAPAPSRKLSTWAVPAGLAVVGLAVAGWAVSRG